MVENLGNDVSYVSESAGYNYDMVVFQEQKPPLDSELNLAQELKRIAGQRRLDTLPSGWLTLRPFYTASSLSSSFYTQDPATAIPEYALVNGMVVYVTNTNTDTNNANLIELGDPPSTGNRINGVFLEVWRALLDPDTSDNKPDPEVIIDDLRAVYTYSTNIAWTVGDNGLILKTENAGASWSIQLIDTKQPLNGVSFANDTIGWVVGNSGVIARTSSSGVNWTLLSSGLVENLNDVFAGSQLIVWAVGDAGTILKTSNGINWSAQSSGVTADLNGLYFYDTQVGWVTGANGTILKTTDGGTNWMQLTSGITTNLNSIYFYDLNFGFAVGEGGVILRTSDGGLTWVVQSGNIYDPDTSTYSSLSIDYTDVTMVPNLDEFVNGEEISGQFTGSNKNGTVMNVPVTEGDGNGTTTNVPTDIRVTVNDVDVLVDVLDGTTGQIVLHEAPRNCDTVKVYYYYRISSEIFRGRAWITGKSGTVLRTDDIGAKWIQQDPDTAYDINSVDFVNIDQGWVVGQFSVIRSTEDGGTTWVTQVSDVVSRQQQRVYKEGNVDTTVFLTEDSIHPDTNIETTKRVQIQYRIRVESNVDPINFPEAGLGNTAIVGLGPNDTGSFAFENMGAVTGDYGLWQAKCSGTVDGYCWAIPLAFVGRRNSANYNTETNANGSHTDDTVRPDLLTGTDIVDADLLDVRRKVLVPDINELLDRNFDLLMRNDLRTQIVRDTVGGDRYGTEILNVDRIGGTDDDGGRLISGANLADAVSGDVKSTAEITSVSNSFGSVSTVPEFVALTPPSGSVGIFHTNPVYYTATYVSTTPSVNGRRVPGYFEGFGTQEVRFYFNVDALTNVDDTNLTAYLIQGSFIDISSSALTFIPTDPKLVENFGVSTVPSFYYQGVLDTERSGRLLESWDSGIPGYTNSSKIYPYVSDDTVQQHRASPVVVTYYMRLTAADIVGVNTINVPRNLTVTGGVSVGIAYSCYTVSTLKNVTDPSGEILYLLNDQKPISGDLIQLISTTGFNFVEDQIFEITYMVISQTGDNIRNGSALSFVKSDKGIENFTYSDLFTKSETGPISSSTFLIADGTLNIPGTFRGMSTAATADSVTQSFAIIETIATIQLYPVTVTAFGSTSIEINYLTSVPTGAFDVTIQAMVLQTDLLYNDSVAANGLLIGYNYTPHQAVNGLPDIVTTQMATTPKNVYLSNLGTGGSEFTRDPYDNPIVQIPTNDGTIADDDSFYNVDLFRFSNISVDGGFVQMPVYVPGSFGEDVTFSVPVRDNLDRTYYSIADKEFLFKTEGIKIGLSRKIFIPVLARVSGSSDDRLLRGEYVLLIISRNTINELENYTGYEISGNSVIAVYRLPNKPLVRF